MFAYAIGRGVRSQKIFDNLPTLNNFKCTSVKTNSILKILENVPSNYHAMGNFD